MNCSTSISGTQLDFSQNATNCTGGIPTNSDISGIGVRAAFYIQTAILGQSDCMEDQIYTMKGYLTLTGTLSPVLLVDRSIEDALGSLWTLISLSFGLTLAAISIIPDSQQPLNLLQAIIVSILQQVSNYLNSVDPIELD